MLRYRLNRTTALQPRHQKSDKPVDRKGADEWKILRDGQRPKMEKQGYNKEWNDLTPESAIAMTRVIYYLKYPFLVVQFPYSGYRLRTKHPAVAHNSLQF